MITKKVGQRIKNLRAEQGLSQEELANSIGMARTYLAEVETGKRNVSIKNIERIAAGFNKSIAQFFGDDIFK